MTTNEIKAKISEAMSLNRPLKLIGYHSSSTQTMTDMTVKLGGGKAYEDLLHESIAELGRLSDACPESLGVLDSEWKQAKQEQRTAWQESLQRSVEDAPSKRADAKYKPAPEGWWIDPNDPDVVVLKNLVADTMSPKKVAAHRNGLTAAKAYLREVAPIRKFVGMVLLSPTKVREIELA